MGAIKMTFEKCSDIKFGTSGLRGIASGFTSECVAAYIFAFLKILEQNTKQKIIYIGADLRQSSPRISANCIAAAKAFGWQPIYGGNVPTPALAAYAMAKNCPAIMVTGSHVPNDYNGMKFYRPKGELSKNDETPIKENLSQFNQSDFTFISEKLPAPNPEVRQDYINRYINVFPKNALSGLKLGIDMHSAVGRNILLEIFEILGAKCFPYNHSETFIALDTEALDKADIINAKTQIKTHNLDAVISTDGDGDRPLLLDENGNQINGDVVGAIAAKYLNIKTIVTPLTSTSAIEKSGWFNKIIRTNIGSPYVVAAMSELKKADAPIAGFEANGGFLLQSDIKLPNGNLSPLPTRDAILPLIATLIEAKNQSISISNLANTLPPRFMRADRIKQVPNDIAIKFLYQMQTSKTYRKTLDARLENPNDINTQDGVRMSFTNDSIIHFRQSGNAPEMRIYVETDDKEQTDITLAILIKNLSKHLHSRGRN